MNNAGAGFVVIKKFGNQWKVLGLKINGKYDLPKGGKESLDSDLYQTAVRECEEECSIIIKESDVLFNFDHLDLGPLRVFIAQTDQVPKIKKNEKSGIFEHDGYEWLDFNDLEKNIISYLKPAIVWSRNKMGY